MYTYSILHWFLFFYIYSFFGWIWETVYVSIGSEKWVNRGFMHGPFLPIYGFGCVGMVFVTIPVHGNMLYEFIIGVIGATIMEYCTGVVMEKLFHLRYWDYSDFRFNLNGYISLKSSLTWGVFAILVSEVLHVRVARVVMQLPYPALELAVIILTAYFAADFSQSFREALDLKEILANLTQSNQEISKIEKGVESLYAFVNGDLKDRSEAGLKMINTTIHENKLKYRKTAEAFGEIKGKITKAIEELAVENADKKKNIREELEAYREKISWEEHFRMTMGNKKAFKKVTRLVKRNPGMKSADYSEALQEIQEYKEEK